jgi:hypothetical protein
VNWLVCEKICILGSAKLNLDLPVAQTVKPANVELFEKWTKHLPIPAGKLSGVGVNAEPLDISSGSGSTEIRTTLAMRDLPIPDAVEGLELTVGAPRAATSGTCFPIHARLLQGHRVTARTVEVLVGPYMVTIPIVGAAGPATAPASQ